ncbi:DegV family protein [Chloroflexota bacterium]
MTIKIVTDSTSDISPELAQDMGITVVPVYVRFGTKVYRDGVDINHDEFYHKLVTDPAHPSTSQPAPTEFADVYNKLSQEADGIVSIHVSSRLSGTCNSAIQGRGLAKRGCPIRVVDSLSLSMGLGLTVIAAARSAYSGGDLRAVMDEVEQTMGCIRVLGLLDTLKYLLQGGRIGKAKAFLGTLLNVKPMLTLRDGELVPAGLARTRTKGIERLYDFAKSASDVQEMAIVHSTTPDEASLLSDTISSIFPVERIHIARLGPALGAHGGPGTVIVALRDKVSSITQYAGEGDFSRDAFSSQV